ncbi:hypothetical protein [Bradyrhizobium guangzhouense]|uniref:hypothetical protein n=1 Tax=Bradyrhizobium guangzhouense TaxID=1325095 RepID=UPI001FDEC3F3|nr:hypothetical protein [Bradyrhizobium guangzhouense]
MALSKLQSDILRLLAKNRSDSSDLAGGLMLNKDWERRSDDIDIFHDTDEEVTDSAKADIAVLDAAGFKTHRDYIIYGCVDATISRDSETTIIQWFAETRIRFFPFVKDEQWGARLHQADLAVNKVLAAAGRSKARDIADIVAIGRDYCPLGPLVLAAAGKPPNFSPSANPGRNPSPCAVDSGRGVCRGERTTARMDRGFHSRRGAAADRCCSQLHPPH